MAAVLGRGTCREGLARFSRCFEIGASRGKMLREVGAVGVPPPAVDSYFWGCAGTPSMDLHGRGTAVLTDPRLLPCQWLCQSQYLPTFWF